MESLEHVRHGLVTEAGWFMTWIAEFAKNVKHVWHWQHIFQMWLSHIQYIKYTKMYLLYSIYGPHTLVYDQICCLCRHCHRSPWNHRFKAPISILYAIPMSTVPDEVKSLAYEMSGIFHPLLIWRRAASVYGLVYLITVCERTQLGRTSF